MGIDLTRVSPKFREAVEASQRDKLRTIGQIVSAPVTYPDFEGREDDMQAEIFRWIDNHKEAFPALQLAFHAPNGGRRGKIEASRLVGLGVRPGVPDLMLPCRGVGAFSSFIGLAIELKVRGNQPTPSQEAFASKLRAADWLALSPIRNADHAIDSVKIYLGI